MDTMTPVDELLFGMHSTIEQFGWMLMSVFGDGRHPPWTYTIGLSRRCSHPELVMVGLPTCCAGEVLNQLGTQVEAGQRFDRLPGGETSVDGRPYRVVSVHPKHWGTDLFAAWLNYYGTIDRVPDPAALQIVWADDAGRFPGDPAFDRTLRRRQRRLDRAPRKRKRTGV